MHMSKLLAGLAATLTAAALFAAPNRIPLQLDAGAWQEGPSPLGVGLPLKEGMAKDLGRLAVVDARGARVPAQFQARTRYPDGSVMWLWADFIAPEPAEYFLALDAAEPAPADTMTTVGAGKIRVDNGLLTFEWDKTFATPVKVSTRADGRERTIASGDGRGVYLVTNEESAAVLGGAKADLAWQVETDGPVRCVLRCEGWYTTTTGERVARAVVRYHVYRDTSRVRMEHTFVVTQDNDKVWYKDIGIRLPLGAKDAATAVFSDAEGALCRETLRGKETAWVFQKEHPVYVRRDRVCERGRDDETLGVFPLGANWSALEADGTSLVLAMKDFAAQFPKEFLADGKGLTLKLWSGRDGRKLDYNPKTLAADWWREWVDAANAPRYNKKVEAAQPESIRNGSVNPSCVGVARNHALAFAYLPVPAEATAYRRLGALAQTPPLALADPRWTCHCDPRAFWTMAAKGEGGEAFEDIEEFISLWFDQFMVPNDFFVYAGFYDYGRHPELRYYRVGEGEEARIYPHWFRLSVPNIYFVSKFLMMGYARSGDRRCLDAAYDFTRPSG
jgi:hypothetical protein